MTRRQDEEQDAVVELMDDAGLASLLEKQSRGARGAAPDDEAGDSRAHRQAKG